MKPRSSFGGPDRRIRRSRAPIIWIVLVVLLFALFALLWSKGGEKPMVQVEKAISADRLGK